MDPFSLAMTGAQMLPGLLGGQQVAPPAPAYQPGVQGGLNQLTAMGQDNLNMIPGLLQGRVNPVQDAMTGIEGAPEPPAETAPEAPQQGFGDAFFGSLDNTFSSPAKLIGVGLLNRQANGLGTGLLLGKGLLDAFRR